MIKVGWVEERVINTGKRLKVYYEDENGQKQGCYVEFYPGTDKHLIIQRYIDDRLNGRSFIINPDKEISSIVYYKDGIRHGPARYLFTAIKPYAVYCFFQLEAVEGERIELW